MDFTLGVITGIYGVIALIIFYIVYIIEVKLDIPYASNENGDFRGLSHNRLRQLIECIIAETLRLPNLSQSAETNEITAETNHNSVAQIQNVTTTPNKRINGEYFEPNSYQELLATAVLNKIVDTHGKIDGALTGSSPNLSSGYDRNHNHLHKQRTSSESSSIEPQSESSFMEVNKLLNEEQIKKFNSISPYESYSNLNNGRTSMLSDYIAGHMVPLPDISGAATTTTEIDSEEDDDDNLSQTSTVSHEDTWEKNWLFKKKHNKGKMTSANSVGMLVPAPKDDVRAQIGDKTADEISDLSEAGSDIEESSVSSSFEDIKIDPQNDRLLNKHLIGGKNTADVLDEMIDQASLVSTSTLPDYQPTYKETINENVKGIDDIMLNAEESKIESVNNVSSPTKSPKNGAQLNGVKNDDQTNGNANDSYDDEENTRSPSSSISGPLSDQNSSNNSCCTPTIIDSSEIDSSNDDERQNDENTLENTTNNVTNNLQINQKYENIETFESTCSIDVNNSPMMNGDEHVDDDNNDIFRHFVPGSIAEREYQKWYNAVEMPNNPYSPEALRRRLSTSSERFIDLPNISSPSQPNPMQMIATKQPIENRELSQQRNYQRYSRDYYINDAKYSSGMKKHSTDNNNSHGYSNALKESENIHEMRRTPSPIVKDLFSTSETQSSPSDVYLATPAIIDDGQFESFETTPTSTNNSSLTQSDDSDTIRIYNLKNQKTIIKKNDPQSNEPEPKIESILNSENPTQNSPTKGQTPDSLKFLQPKRKLIEPHQVLSPIDTKMPLVIQTPIEKKVIEEDIVQALPSVKALAQTFLKTCNKNKQSESRLNKPTQKRNKTSKSSGNRNSLRKKSTKSQQCTITQSMASQGSPADDATIASDLSSLETDPSSTQDQKPSRPLSPILIPSGYLKNNIAFFENLKNK